jgi:hypothetical protein
VHQTTALLRRTNQTASKNITKAKAEETSMAVP